MKPIRAAPVRKRSAVGHENRSLTVAALIVAALIVAALIVAALIVAALIVAAP